MAMTNAQIIFLESCRLLEAGVIGSTGKVLSVENPDGTKTEMMEPEAIHTFAAWKARGFSVKKGEHAVAKFAIWKHATKTVEDDDGNEKETSRMFLKTAAFFTASQVELTADKPKKERKTPGSKSVAPAILAPAPAASYGNWLTEG
jgi:hypothetical protein